MRKRRIGTADEITTPTTSLIGASNIAEGATTKKLININWDNSKHYNMNLGYTHITSKRYRLNISKYSSVRDKCR
jgi:hypothetical protein